MRLRRMTEVIQILSEEGLGFLVKNETYAAAAGAETGGPATGGIPPEAQRDVELARRLRCTLDRLGPTFVKFGQILATRVDVFSEEFCAELGKLHSRAAPIPYETIVEVVESELGGKLREVFATFEPTPIAAASIAQVHAATLANGRAVVVKVQRPSAKEQMLGDLEVLLTLSRWLDKIFTPYRRTMVHRLAEEQRKISARELNFRNEAEAARRLAAYHREDAGIKIPEVFADLCTERVIVMERFEGPKLDEIRTPEELRARGIEPEVLVKRLLKTILRQSFDFGLLHADMHPGNLFILPGGVLGIIDFGMHMEVPKEVREGFIRLARLRAVGRLEEATDVVLTELCQPTSHSDVKEFRKAYIEHCKAHDNLAADEYSYGQSLLDESRLGSKYELVSPPEMIAIARALLVCDGIVLRMCPSLQMMPVIQETILGIMQQRVSLPNLLEQARQMLPDLLEAVERNPEFHRGLLRIRHSFASAHNLKEFLEREGFSWAVKKSEGALLRLLAAFALGAVSAAAIIKALH